MSCTTFSLPARLDLRDHILDLGGALFAAMDFQQFPQRRGRFPRVAGRLRIGDFDGHGRGHAAQGRPLRIGHGQFERGRRGDAGEDVQGQVPFLVARAQRIAA